MPFTPAARPATSAPTTLWTLPNIVSLSRVVLAAGFVASTGPAQQLAYVGAASITDFLDGWLARRRNAVTRWGALLDPIADRIFVLSAVATFVAHGKLAVWEAFALLLRDVMTVIGFFVARSIAWLRPVRFRARPLGKVVTGFQLATLFAVIVAPWLALPQLASWLVVIVLLLAVAATVDYTLLLWRERER